jgi:hypothetical protein
MQMKSHNLFHQNSTSAMQILVLRVYVPLFDKMKGP